MTEPVAMLYALMFDDPEHGECISSTMMIGVNDFPLADVFSAREITGTVPLEKKVSMVKEVGRLHAARTGMKYRLVKFTRGEVVEEFG